MQPQSFDDFLKAEQEAEGLVDPAAEFSLTVCPTPGCGSEELTTSIEDGLFSGFTCHNGCRFVAKRNSFTGDLIYYALVFFVERNFEDPASIRGMKFNLLGEIFTDWY